MNRVVIKLFGPFQVFLNDRPVCGFESVKVRALLAYLAIEGALPLSRRNLAEMFWPDRPERVARNNFKQALANLRKVLGDRKTHLPIIMATSRTVQYDPRSGFWLDVAELQSSTEAVAAHRHDQLETCDPCITRFQRAVQLIRGAFLSQLTVSDSPAFDEWVLVLRERYHQQAEKVFSALAGYHERLGEYPQAYEIVQRQLELAPWDESAHMNGIRLLALMGRRSAALRQFDICRRMLREELDVAPSARTIALYNKIKESMPGATSTLEFES